MFRPAERKTYCYLTQLYKVLNDALKAQISQNVIISLFELYVKAAADSFKNKTKVIATLKNALSVLTAEDIQQNIPIPVDQVSNSNELQLNKNKKIHFVFNLVQSFHYTYVDTQIHSSSDCMNYLQADPISSGSLIKYVVRGAHDTISAYLSQLQLSNPESWKHILNKGYAKEPCGRNWESISPLQFAAWAGDIFLVYTLLSYIPQQGKVDAINQLIEVVKGQVEHGQYMNPFLHLVKAGRFYEENFQKLQQEKNLDNYCIHVIGGLQYQLPFLGLQWYCDPQPFSPLPLFNRGPARTLFLCKKPWDPYAIDSEFGKTYFLYKWADSWQKVQGAWEGHSAVSRGMLHSIDAFQTLYDTVGIVLNQVIDLLQQEKIFPIQPACYESITYIPSIYYVTAIKERNDQHSYVEKLQKSIKDWQIILTHFPAGSDWPCLSLLQLAVWKNNEFALETLITCLPKNNIFAYQSARDQLIHIGDLKPECASLIRKAKQTLDMHFAAGVAIEDNLQPVYRIIRQ